MVPGGTWTLWGLSYLLLLPFACVGAFVQVATGRAGKRRQVEQLRVKIADLRSRLDRAVDPPPPTSLRAALNFVAVLTVGPVLLVVINLLLR